MPDHNLLSSDRCPPTPVSLSETRFQLYSLSVILDCLVIITFECVCSSPTNINIGVSGHNAYGAVKVFNSSIIPAILMQVSASTRIVSLVVVRVLLNGLIVF